MLIGVRRKIPINVSVKMLPNRRKNLRSIVERSIRRVFDFGREFEGNCLIFSKFCTFDSSPIENSNCYINTNHVLWLRSRQTAGEIEK